MATSGIIVKNAALAMVNGVYSSYTPDSLGERWLSNDKLCIMRFVEQTVYSKLEYNEDTVYDENFEAITAETSFYSYNSITEEYTPITLEYGDVIFEKLGNLEKTMLPASLEETPRQLTLSEKAMALNGTRVYWLKNLSTNEFTKVEEDQLSTVFTISQSGGDSSVIEVLYYSEPIHILCTQTQEYIHMKTPRHP